MSDWSPFREHPRHGMGWTWDSFSNEEKAHQPQGLTRDDWPTLYLPDTKNRGEYVQHTVKPRMGFT